MLEFKRYMTKVKFNGRQLPVEILIELDQEDESPDGSFDFGDAEENAKYLKRFESGELFSAWVRVTATLGLVDGSDMHVSGSDSLGNCHIHSNNLFNSEPFDSDVRETVKVHGMVKNAIADLKAQIRSTVRVGKVRVKVLTPLVEKRIA